MTTSTDASGLPSVAARTTSNTTSQLVYLTRVLRAPAIRNSLERLAKTAREEGWSHQEYLAAVLGREVVARATEDSRERGTIERV